MITEKLRIAYERLSRDDEQQGESNSIKNQKMLLEEYAARNGYTNLTHLTDDGWSGTRWDRPSIVKLIEEVERGNVEIVIVKDMSRLGRDHLRVGGERNIKENSCRKQGENREWKTRYGGDYLRLSARP